MKTLELNASGRLVKVLQYLLNTAGKSDDLLKVDGQFGQKSKRAVETFQKSQQLPQTGVVDESTWRALFRLGYQYRVGINNWVAPGAQVNFLPESEYIKAQHEKKTIILHHTAGWHWPDRVFNWWLQDRQENGERRRVATAFTVGGPSRTGDKRYDGVIYRGFPEIYWAHHLGLKGVRNTPLNQAAIGIEICSLGPLFKGADGKFYPVILENNANIANYSIPKDQVCDLGFEWRGYRYFLRYSTAQIESTRRLILTLAYFFDIPIPNRKYDAKWLDLQEEAFTDPGVWTHTNFRLDKTDCFPQVEFIDMLNNLHKDFATFDPFTLELEAVKADQEVNDDEWMDQQFLGTDL
jgi:peptidoglycan hydrolase-like protein with peptidoglycan-binding domain